MPFPFRRTLHMRARKNQTTIRDLTCHKDGWTAEPKNFVNLFCAVIYDLLWRILYAGEDGLAGDIRNPTQTSPLAVIMASIVPRACKPEGPAISLKPEAVYPYRSRYRKRRPRTSSHGCPSRALKQPSIQISMHLMMRGEEKIIEIERLLHCISGRV